MAKWYCNWCEEYFDEPETEYEHHSELNGMGGIQDEEFCVCPKCHEEDIEECTDECEACGEIVRRTTDVGGIELCPDCYEKLREICSEAKDKVTGTLDKIDSIQAEVLIGNFYNLL